MIIRNEEDARERLAATAAGCVREFLEGAPRREELRRVYDGQHAISRRDRPEGLPNNRLAHDFPRYICTMAAGYLIGAPVTYESRGEVDEQALSALREAYQYSDCDSVDVELARSASLYGKGVELVFADRDGRPRVAALSAESAFVVYDDTVENRPLMGIRLIERVSADGRPAGWATEVRTADEIVTALGDAPGDFRRILTRERHWFGGVPVVEYWNGEDERGDFEGVLPLIDAYDRLQSDRLNDKEQFVDSLLVLTGCTMETDARGRSPEQQIRDAHMLMLPDGDSRAEWLSKRLEEADCEVLKKALAADIHKLSLVPDLSDAQFAGNASGVALRYRLLGLEQLTRVKERWFREGLRCRMRLFARFLEISGRGRLDCERVEPVFHRTLPADELARAQTVRELVGLLPEEEIARRAMAVGD